MYGQGYGNEQAMFTMNRAAYGDVPAAMMTPGSMAYGGAAAGLQNMMADVGRVVMPVMYSAPSRAMVGYYGTYQQPTGFFRSGAAAMGFTTVPRGTSALDYSYNAAGDFGERMGSGLVGAGLTAGGIAFGATAGNAIGGFAGAAVGSIFGPVGTAVGGFLGSTIGGYAIGASAAGSVSKAIEERRQIQSFLEQSSFRFVGAGSSMSDTVLGSGMSRGARRESAEFLRGMDIRDKTLDMSDLTQILQQGSQLGLFNGSRDMADFQRKFKDITESVKSVTKVLHQTLQEGMKTIADLKGVGIDASSARFVVNQADALGKVAGRTGQEMIGLGLQGADMFRGTGVSMGIGFQASQMNLASVRAARDFGTLSQEAIAQAGGEEALALRMTAGGLSFAQSAMGRGFNAAFAGPGGGLNQQAFMKNMMGGGNFLQNVYGAANNLSSPAALIAFQANQAQFLSDMGKQMGGRGLEFARYTANAQYAEYIAGQTGASKIDAFKLSMLQNGASQSEIDVAIAQMKDPAAMFNRMQSGVEATASKARLDAAYDNMFWNRAGAAIGDQVKRVTDVVAEPANRIIDNISQGVQNFTLQQVYGVQSTTTTGMGLGRSIRLTAEEERLRQGMFKGANLNKGGWFGGITAGESLASVLNQPGMQNLLGAYTNVRANEEEALARGETVLRNERSSALGGVQWGFKLGVSTLDAGAEESIMRKGRMLTAVTSSEAAKMAESGALGGVKGNTLAQLFASGGINKVNSGESLLVQMFGQERVSAGLSKEEMAFAISQTEGTQAGKFLSESRVGAQKAMDAVSGVSMSQLKEAVDTYKSGVAGLERSAGTKLSPEAIALMMKAKDEALNPDKQQEILSEAMSEQAKFMGAGASPEEVKKAVNRGFGNALALDVTRVGFRQSQLIQENRGRTAVSRLIETELASEAGSKLSPDDAAIIGGFGVKLANANSPAQIKELLSDKEEIKKVKQLATGNFIVEKMEGVSTLSEKLSGVDRSKSDSREKFRDILTGAGLSGDTLAEALKLASSGKTDQVTEMAMSSFQQSLTTKGGSFSGSGAASTSGDPDAQGAGQAAEVQTNINIQTLAAMQGLAQRLGVR